MLNKVILIGNLGKDPEVRSPPSGQPVATWTMATSRRWRDKAAEAGADRVAPDRLLRQAGGDRRPVLQKGKQIYVEGRIQTRSWDDRNTGEKKYRTEIVCDNFQMLGQRGGGGGGGGSSDYSSALLRRIAAA